MESPLSTTSPPHPPALLSVAKVAKALDCGLDHVYRLIKDGHLQVVDIGLGGRLKRRVLVDSLNAYIDSRRVPPRQAEVA